MKPIPKKAVALAAVVCLLFSLAACRGAESALEAASSEESGPSPSSGVSAAASELASSLLEQSAVDVAPSAASETDAASSSAQETAAPSTAATAAERTTDRVENAKPSSKAEIVAYFNDAANRVKTEKPGLVKTEKIAFQVEGSGAVASIANQVQRALKSVLNPEPVTVKKGESHNAVFPVENQSWASRLPANAVSSADCTEKGDTYVITIRMKTEHISYQQAKQPLQTTHGKVVDILQTGEIEEQMAGLSWLVTLHDVDQTYTGTVITCTVDKQSRRLRTAQYHIVSRAAIRASAPFIGETTVNATLTFDQNYQF